jgi:UDP:flavonoid glycosyltransferase YjiC (YdhE family)
VEVLGLTARKDDAMRVLFTCLPYSGHFYPLVPFARVLAAAGHDVAFAAPAFFASAVEGADFRHFPAGFAHPIDTRYPRWRTLPGPERDAFWHEVFTDLWPRHTIPDLLALAATWPPDLIVREQTAYGGCIAAERLGVPHASVDIDAAGHPPGDDKPIAAPLNRQRAAHGLKPDPELIMLNRYLTLHPFPPTFHNPAASRPPTLHFVRPTPEDRSGSEALPQWIESLPDRPVVYVGLGTVYNQPAVFRAFIAGLRDAAVTLIVTVGRDQDPADYGPQPGNVHIERYIPLSLLLPHCDLVVTNGGSGTLTAALGHGLPLVVVPIAADHPANAARCAALGLGRVVGVTELTPERARDAVLGVLGNSSYRHNAERLRDEIASLPGPEDAVALLERLAAEKRPVLTGSGKEARDRAS